MPKKHRVKRQKYVEYLLSLEKEREKYLAARKGRKRSRDSENEELNGEAEMVAPNSKEGGATKRIRHEKQEVEEEQLPTGSSKEESKEDHAPVGRSEEEEAAEKQIEAFKKPKVTKKLNRRY